MLFAMALLCGFFMVLFGPCSIFLASLANLCKIMDRVGVVYGLRSGCLWNYFELYMLKFDFPSRPTFSFRKNLVSLLLYIVMNQLVKLPSCASKTTLA